MVLTKGTVLVLSIGLIATLHYTTNPSHVVLHVVFQRAFYVPVILAAYWFGVVGGVTAAAVCSIVYLPHIHAAWVHNAAYTASQLAELVVFFVIGVSVGVITSIERKLVARYREAAESLERANQDLRDSQEHLRRAERLSALGEIAAGLAHEIRNPLAGIKGALEIITSRVAPGTPDAEFAGVATKELGQLEDLVTEFLTYARPRHPELRQTDVRALLDHVVTLLTPQADRAGVALRCDSTDALQPIRIDPQQIEQVVVNIVLNAIQASPGGSLVLIRIARRPAAILIEVMDEGAGIAPEHAPLVFDPFFTTKARGTGLGLAISQRIVAAHGGSITIEPRRPRGTTVRIELPPGGGSTGA